MAARAKQPARANLLATYHAGAKTLYRDEHGRPDEDLRRAALARMTAANGRPGKRSARDCTDAELRRVIAELRAAGAYDGQHRGGTGPDRPTPEQWAAMAGLSRRRGWNGLDDARLQEFCEHTTGISSTRMLTRAQASAVITGLRRWAGQEAQP
jgi:hypothetical protein